jgi:signal peptidase I
MLNLKRSYAWLRRSGLLVTIVTVGLALSFRSAVADWNDVPTGSMQPTILVGDRIFVNKLAYDLKIPFTRTSVLTWRGPVRGDIVTCWSPADGARLVKRVIGVPGDVLEIRDSRLVLNGQVLAYTATDSEAWAVALGDEAGGKSFATEQLPGHPHVVAVTPAKRALRDFGPVTVPAGSYFMMGDNRDNSSDSRVWGFVPEANIVGKAFFIWFNFSELRRFGRFS